MPEPHTWNCAKCSRTASAYGDSDGMITFTCSNCNVTFKIKEDGYKNRWPELQIGE